MRHARRLPMSMTFRRVSHGALGLGFVESGLRLLDALMWRPQDIAAAGRPIQRAAEDEHQVGEPVEVLARVFGERFVIAEADDAAFDAAADRADEVRQRRSARAARQNELLERRQRCVEVGDQLFEAQNLGLADGGVAGDGDFSAQVEQVVLYLQQGLADVFRQILGKQDAQRRIEFIDLADDIDALTIFGDARTIAETGSAGIAGAGDNL